MNIINWIFSISAETAVNISLVVFLLGMISYLYIMYCTDNVDDNEVGLADWLHLGFYGNVKVGPRVILFKLPGAEFIIHSLKPRREKAIIDYTFISEPNIPPEKSNGSLSGKKKLALSRKNGNDENEEYEEEAELPKKVKMSFILQLKKDVTKEGFKTFHAIQNSLEEGVKMYMEALIDNEVREMRIQEDGGFSSVKNLQRTIEERTKTQLEEHLDKISDGSVKVFNFGLKIDYDDDVRQAMKAPQLQYIKNKASQYKADQMQRMIRDFVTAGAIGDMAAILASSISENKEANIKKSIFEIKGLEQFKGLIDEKTAKHILEIFNKFREGGDKK